MTMGRGLRAAWPLLGGALILATGCAELPRCGAIGTRLDRCGDEIMVCGQLVHTGAPVVLWTDPGGYDAYRAECRFQDQELPTKPVSSSPIRYGSMRRHVPADVQADVREHGWTLDELAQYVDLFVMHYDVCGTSRRCFTVLQDRRGLSVHFMLDVDGTIYQTLDLKERAWHAGQANDRSIGIEIANLGAYADPNALNGWYEVDDRGEVYLTFPADYGVTGIRGGDTGWQPARNEPVEGQIHNRTLYQYDLTDAQYDSLIKLVAAVSCVLPKIRLDCPRDENGAPLMRRLTAPEYNAFEGVLGHYHLTEGKVDPGPAFDWERVLGGARAELAKE